MKKASRAATLAALLAMLLSPLAADTPPAPLRPSTNAVAAQASNDFYNANYAAARRLYEQLLAERPQDPFAYNSLAAVLMYQELTRIGAMDVESYTSESFLDDTSRPHLDPAVKHRLEELWNKSEELTDARLRANERDFDALYARGVERGMRSTWQGMAEKSWLPALRSALAARHDHEALLAMDPGYIDAKLIPGTHNYIIGSLNWAYRAAVALGGVTGNKQKGLQMLSELAYSKADSSMDAKIALALFLRHEKRYDEDLRLVLWMTEHYPHNYLLALEYGNLLMAAGRGMNAVRQFESMVDNLKLGRYHEAQPELAYWGLGCAARGQDKFDLSARSFDTVAASPHASAHMKLKALLLAGEMYDQLGWRPLALDRYQKILARDGVSNEAAAARKHIKKPYVYKSQDEIKRWRPQPGEVWK